MIYNSGTSVLTSRIFEPLDCARYDPDASQEAGTLALLHLALVPDRYRNVVVLAQVQIVMGIPLGLQRCFAYFRFVLLCSAIDANFCKRVR